MKTDDSVAHPTVLHICDKLGAGGASIHGVSRLLSWWFPEFENKGWQPKLCVLRPRDNAGAYFEERAISVHYLGRSKFDMRTVTDLISLMRKEKPDVVHLHGYGAWTFGRIAAKITRTPTVLHEHMVGENVPLIQKVADKILSSDDPTCVVSQAVFDFCINHRFIKYQDVVIIPNGIPLSEFSPPTDKAIFRFKEDLGLQQDALLIGSIGRLDSRKGYEFLIRAAPALVKRHPNLKVLIAGDGELEHELKQLSADLGISHQVMLLGYRRDVSTLLAALSVVIIPSLSEGLPLSLLEAMAIGKPIVSTTAGGLGEVLVDGETALLVKARNPLDITEKVSKILTDSAMARQLAANAQKLVYQQYDIKIAAQMIIRIYEKLCSKNAK